VNGRTAGRSRVHPREVEFIRPLEGPRSPGLTEPSDLTGLPGRCTRRWNKPPRRGRGSYSLRTRASLSAVQEGHEVGKPRRVAPLTARFGEWAERSRPRIRIDSGRPPPTTGRFGDRNRGGKA